MYKESVPDTVFYNAADPSHAIVTVIGRICSDANEGKTNERSLVLETSRAIGGGSRVRLDLTEVTEFSFFPGQIVVLSGINAHGFVFAVTRVHEVWCYAWKHAYQEPTRALAFIDGHILFLPVAIVANG